MSNPIAAITAFVLFVNFFVLGSRELLTEVAETELRRLRSLRSQGYPGAGAAPGAAKRPIRRTRRGPEKRVQVALWIALVAAAAPLSAQQQTPEIGRTTRVWTAKYGMVEGRLEEWTDESLVIRADGLRYTLPTSSVEAVQTNAERGTRARLGGIVGSVFGGLIGFAWGHIEQQEARNDARAGDCSLLGPCSDYGRVTLPEEPIDTGAIIVSTVVGAASGALVGGLIGTAFKTGAWGPVQELEVQPRLTWGTAGSTGPTLGFQLRF